MRAWVVAVVLSLMPLCLCAQAKPTKPTKAQLNEAKKHFKAGETAYRLQEWDKALTEFQEAYRLSQYPELLFNIAQCYRRLENYDEALTSFRGFLYDVPESPEREEATLQIQEIEAILAKKKADAERAEAERLAPKKKGVPNFVWVYGGASASLVAGGVFGALTLATGRRLEEGIDANQGALDNQKLTRLALTSDICVAAALIGGGVGLFLQHKSRSKVEVSSSGTTVVVAAHF